MLTRWMPTAVAWAALVAAMLRIQTYVTGQDPFIYISQARSLLSHGFSAESLGALARFIAPGYPVLLAVAIKVFGPFAPHWVNLFLAMGAWLFLALILRRLLNDWRAELVTMLAALLAVLGGYPLNAHFLLYAFRGAPMLFFSLAGLLLALTAADRPRPGLRLVLAGSVLLCGVVVRETVVFPAAGVAAWLLIDARMKGRRLRLLSCFLLPWALTAAAAAAALCFSPMHVNSQTRAWIGQMTGYPLSHFLAALIARLARMGGFLIDELHWPGVALLIAGAWKFRRRFDVLALLVLPAALLLLFYACYSAHRRFFLDSLFFLAPVAGCGLAALLEWARSLPTRRGRGRWSAAALAFVSAALSALLVLVVLRMSPWGPRVGAAQVFELQDTVRSLGDPKTVYVDPQCRYLVDALVSWTCTGPASPADLASVPAGERCGFFARPLNEACYQEGEPRSQEVSGERILDFFADSSPAGAAESLPEILLGEARFRIERVKAREMKRVSCPLEAERPESMVAWLDFRDTPQDCPWTVSVLDAEGGVLREWRMAAGSGLQPVYLGPELMGRGRLTLVVSSPCPLPAQLLVATAHGGAMTRFSLLQDRRLATEAWFAPPFDLGRRRRKYAAVMVSGGMLRLPVPAGDGPMRMEVRLAMTSRFQMPHPLKLTYRLGNAILAEDTVPARPMLVRHTLIVPSAPAGGTAEVEVTVDPPDCFGSHLRLHAISIGATACP